MGNEKDIREDDMCIGGVGNTRPENTYQSDLRVLVDWVSVTFDLPLGYDEVKQLIGLGNLEMEYHDWGFDTFQTHMRFGQIYLLRKGDHTYHLQLRGQGCREYEQLSSIDWIQLISLLRDFTRSKFTRLDIAIDDFSNKFTVNMIRKAFLNNQCVTRMKVGEDKKRYRTSDLSTIMDTFYFGSMQSRLSLNFYDKKLEREGAGNEVQVESWTRTELRCKREYADQVADMILLYEHDLGKVAFGVLSKNIRFVRPHDDKNKSRVPIIKWWADFIGKVDKLKFSLEAPDRTIERTKKWVGHQVSPSWSMLYVADPDKFNEFMLESLEDGLSRLNEKHYMMIEQYQALEYEKAKRKLLDIEIDSIPNLHERLYDQVQLLHKKIKSNENKPRR